MAYVLGLQIVENTQEPVTNTKWTDKSKLMDILKLIYIEKDLEKYLKKHCAILEENALEYLGQWKELTEKDKYNLSMKPISSLPIPLVKLLDKVALQGSPTLLFESREMKRPRGVDIRQKIVPMLKNWSRNGLVTEDQNYYYVKRDKIMHEIYKQLILPNEMFFYVYYGPTASGKSSLMKTLDPPPNGITIMYVLSLFLISYAVD
jgi:hypothetical protein